MENPETVSTPETYSTVVTPKTRRKRRVMRECHICHAKMDARGINGHLRKHGIGKLSRRRKHVEETSYNNHVPFPAPTPTPSIMDSNLEWYRKGIMDGMKMRQSA